MNEICAVCGGFVGNYYWSGDGAKICPGPCHQPPEGKCLGCNTLPDNNPFHTCGKTSTPTSSEAGGEGKTTVELLDALVCMYEQYCSDGHSFMSAGECASTVLEKYGYEFDGGGRITKHPTPVPSQGEKQPDMGFTPHAPGNACMFGGECSDPSCPTYKPPTHPEATPTSDKITDWKDGIIKLLPDEYFAGKLFLIGKILTKIIEVREQAKKEAVEEIKTWVVKHDFQTREGMSVSSNSLVRFLNYLTQRKE